MAVATEAVAGRDGKTGPIPLDPAVGEFVRRHGLEDLLPRAVALLRECFPNLVRIGAALDHDPEFPDEWITLRVTTPGDIPSLVAANWRFCEEWTAAAPHTHTPRVRLSMDIV